MKVSISNTSLQSSDAGKLYHVGRYFELLWTDLAASDKARDRAHKFSRYSSTECQTSIGISLPRTLGFVAIWGASTLQRVNVDLMFISKE